MTQTYTDTNVNQLTINKLNKTEYNNLPQVSDTELYLVEEQIDDTPTENSTNPVSSGGVYEALQSCTQTAPLGAILPFAGSTIPTNWMLCDGSAISRTTYAELFAVIGTAFGSGDGSTTFNIPDLRETVPVGAGTSTNSSIANHDSYNVGEFKDDQFENHAHSVDYSSSGGVEGYISTFNSQTRSVGSDNTVSGWNSARYGSTTHGKQLGVNYIIRVLGGSSEQPEQPINYNNIPIIFSEASTKQNIESGDTIAEAFGKLQKWNNTPLRDSWNYIATLSSSTSSKQTTSFTVNKAGFFQLIIQGSAIEVNAVARINYPEDNLYNGTSACSATMLNGFGVGNQCYLLPGTYTLEIDKTTGTVVTCNVIHMNDNSAV